MRTWRTSIVLGCMPSAWPAATLTGLRKTQNKFLCYGQRKREKRNYLWSIMRTLTPFLANALHAMTPAGPAPMMSTSTWLSDIDGVGDSDDIR